MAFAKLASVIIPVYNCEKFLPGCLDSLAAQTLPKEQLDVLLINDGSPDGSAAICRRYVTQYPWMRFFDKHNEGVTLTRNFGLRHAEGRFIFFLDSDDSLAANTLEAVADFFAAHESEVDLVTYPIHLYAKGKRVGSHHRFHWMKQSGVFDLENNPYVMQTTMNICVKNIQTNGAYSGILFDPALNNFHEDQAFNCEQLLQKRKIGFCDTGEYRYNRDNGDSLLATRANAYYTFEPTLAWMESMLQKFPQPTSYVQALLFNTLRVKRKDSMLLPHHYAPKELAFAKERVRRVLQQMDDAIILSFPDIPLSHAQHFLRWKYGTEALRPIFGPNHIGLLCEAQGKNAFLLYAARGCECVITKLRLKKGVLHLTGFLRSEVFPLTEKPLLFPLVNGVRQAELPLFESAWGMLGTKEKLTQYWGFHYSCPIQSVSTIAFLMELQSTQYETTLSFVQGTPIFAGRVTEHVFWDGFDIGCALGKMLTVQTCATPGRLRWKRRRAILKNSIRVLLTRSLIELLQVCYRGRSRVWLYADCAGTRKDNGYFQFAHDFEKKDGVRRYYIVDDTLDRKDFMDRRQRRHCVLARSWKHKRLMVQTEKVLASFAEADTYHAFTLSAKDMPQQLNDLLRFEVIYLQHGVLHAHMPWKYSYDRMPVDYEVVSTDFEVDNLTQNYGFPPDRVLRCGMPRYDQIDRSAPPQKKLLLALSWRQYLVEQLPGARWRLRDGEFLKSDFFAQTQAFLGDPRLTALLGKYGYTLEVQTHRIMRGCEKHYSFASEHIRFSTPGTPISDYAAVITDFSSFVFDFVYLRRPVIYFMPDTELFRAGLNGYRALDLPLEEGFGPLTETAEEALAALQALLEQNCAAQEPYRTREDAFFPSLHDCREKLYRALQ
ncbi:MAG: bifunctional glycosyltransferase family 2 protein/CDP-glycerol:glycerophosphate glycerophosphotransferase [Oscillospiraceae bacterium]|jgi:glycosyltransferase involved in cell wall biosynthesis|nr:bifunctional glycosyltransferase family 2 protein/CDP-glycerol:glycerophosphate glycerophosphotransferase [Oscillospiraceae bacterium]